MDEIKEALLSLGYLTTGEQQNVNKALQQFQVYHGLHADGKPGINTIEALRKSTLYRYRVLALNLDRMRKRAQSDSSMLYVNIPAYRLTVFDGKKMTGTFKVIVGNPSTPTPLISGDLQMIIANPVWYVPKKIAINEMLPKIKEDSLYLKRNGFQLLDRNYKVVDASKVDMSEKGFDYTFRQNRGSDNSLGQIKFLFSNPDAIYLHDTPGKQLFEKDIRAFSHGCIRVQNPEALAEEILTSMKSDTASFRQTLKTGQEREFKVTIPLRVQITYITCEADAEGKIYFYKDIYGLDDKELLALGI
jgi:murein L,D-transpeptidase YcbB/YkuD